MSNRFHNKFHRYNHQSYKDPTIPDSGYDPIASLEVPFRGEFILSGYLSAVNPQGYYSILTDNILADEVRATNMYVSNTLTADNIVVNYIDIIFSESSGFGVYGSDFSQTVPAVTPLGNVVLLSGIGLSTSSWAAIGGDVLIRGGLTGLGPISFSSGFICELSACNVYVRNGISAQLLNPAPINLAYQGVAIGQSSYSEGYRTNAIGDYSHAEGNTTTAIGSAAHAEGQVNIALGNFSHAEGVQTYAYGYAAHTEGYGTSANDWSHAEGNFSGAHGIYSHAEGLSSVAFGVVSHAAGVNAQALHNYSYVWSADQNNPYGSSTDHSFSVNASGGINLLGTLIAVSTAIPTLSSDAGVTGQIAWSSGHIYICTSPNTWHRATLAAW